MHPQRKIVRLSLSQVEQILIDHLDLCDGFEPGSNIQLNTKLFTKGCCDNKKAMIVLEIQPALPANADG